MRLFERPVCYQDMDPDEGCALKMPEEDFSSLMLASMYMGSLFSGAAEGDTKPKADMQRQCCPAIIACQSQLHVALVDFTAVSSSLTCGCKIGNCGRTMVLVFENFFQSCSRAPLRRFFPGTPAEEAPECSGPEHASTKHCLC